MEFLNITPKDSYQIVQINRGKVNALNLDMINELRTCFKNMEEDPSVKGVILTGTPHFFTAGLDLKELYEYDEEKMREFFIAFGSLHAEMVKFSKPLIGAITGHSPAGGTVLAIACDYRIMANGEKYNIGLNEVAVNIQISHNLVTAYSHWIGSGKANELILGGQLLSPQKAAACGLVNVICDLEEVLPIAEKQIKHYLQADPTIWSNTKAKLRKDWLENLSSKAELEAELEEAHRIWFSPEIRMRMGAFVQWLNNRKSTKSNT